MNQSLTAKQGRFVDEYIVTECGAEAARRAGYSPCGAKVTACRLLTKPNLQAAIAAKRAELAHKFELDREAVLCGLFEGVAMARQGGDASAYIRGWLAVAKITGLDKPEAIPQAVSAQGGALMAKLQGLTLEELMAVAEAHRVE
jgi:hypothetical protein